KGALTLSSGVAAILVVLKALLSPIGLVAASLGGLTAFIIANIDKTVEFGGKTTTVGNIVSAAWRTIRDTAANTLQAISQAVGVSGSDITNTLSKVSNTAGKLFVDLLKLINELVSGAFSAFRLIARSAGIAAASIVRQFSNGFSN